MVNDCIMTDVFHAYAAKPAFNRSTTMLVDNATVTRTSSPSNSPEAATSCSGQEASSNSTSSVPPEAAQDAELQTRVPQAPLKPQFTLFLPQSNAEVLGEVQSPFPVF